MFERQHACMQRLTREGVHCGLKRFGQFVGFGSERRTVFGIANERVADMGHMDPDLVGTASFKAAFDQACHGFTVFLFAITRQYLEMGHCVPGVTLGLFDDGLACAVFLRAAKGSVDCAGNAGGREWYNVEDEKGNKGWVAAEFTAPAP